MEERGRQEIQAAIRQHTEERRAQKSAQQRRQRRQRLRPWVSTIIICLTLLVAWQGYGLYQNHLRYSVAMRFVRALEKRDAQVICALATPDDWGELDLKPEKVRRALEMLFDGLGETKVIEVVSLRLPPNTENPEAACWRAYWGDSTGKPLPSKFGGDRLYSGVTVLPTKVGYRVWLRECFGSICVSRWGINRGRRASALIRSTTGLDKGGGI